MAKQPFSAPKSRSLPTSTPTQDINQTLANWQTQLQPLIQNVAPQATPQNFSITNSRGGLTLNWSPVAGADGYEILKSVNGSFTDDLQILSVKNANQSSFFDSLGGNSQTVHYRIRTTSGTAANPQSQRGPESGPIKHTSIDASDTKSTPVTFFDTATTDITRSGARLGNYGAIKVSPLGQAGGTLVGSGSKGGAGNSTGRPAQAATDFSTLGTGTNNAATLIVAGSASLIPDPNNPGTINATKLQGTPVTTTAPSSGAVLQVRNGTLQYAVIIATGLQANLQSVLPLALGEIYVATDTGNLFIGTPGVGAGYLLVADMSQVSEKLDEMVREIRALKLAVIALDSTLLPTDFESRNIDGGNDTGEIQ